MTWVFDRGHRWMPIYEALDLAFRNNRSIESDSYTPNANLQAKADLIDGVIAAV